MTLKNRLAHSSPFYFATYAVLMAFCTYVCLFAFRKAFNVATFQGQSFAGVDYKIWLISAQVIGYTVSKFIGIKVVSEMYGRNRLQGILTLALLACTAWLGFGLVSAPYNIIFLFLNGLPLGMGWGLVFSYLEGRRTTEVLGAGLSISFIFSAGFVKTVGSWVMLHWGLSEFWMPLIVSLLFFFPFLIFLYFLDQLPPPSQLDEAQRTKRQAMNGRERIAFFGQYALGLILLIFTYLLLTVFRDFRDNFSAEIWQALGVQNASSLFTLTEVPIALIVMLVISALMFISDNALAFQIIHWIVLVGLALVGLSNWAFQMHWISPPVWMTLVGLGLYLGYVAFNTIFFDRMIATFKQAANVGFLIYLADSIGYVGSISVLFYKNFGQPKLSWLSFFITTGYWVSGLGCILILASWFYFRRKAPRGIEG
jgi:MFS family permease